MRKSTKLLAGMIGLAAALSSTASHAEVVDQTDRSFVTRDTAVVAASPREAWIALIAPARWWNSAHTWSADASNMSILPQGGGCFCERIPPNANSDEAPLAGSAQHMTVVLAMPDQVLRMRGGLGPLQSEPVDGVLTVTLKPVDEGTQILWEYVVGGYFRYDVPVIAKAVDGVMSQQLEGLAKHLGPVSPVQPAQEDAPSGPEEEPEADVPESPARTTVDEAFDDIDIDAQEAPGR